MNKPTRQHADQLTDAQLALFRITGKLRAVARAVVDVVDDSTIDESDRSEILQGAADLLNDVAGEVYRIASPISDVADAIERSETIQ